MFIVLRGTTFICTLLWKLHWNYPLDIMFSFVQWFGKAICGNLFYSVHLSGLYLRNSDRSENQSEFSFLPWIILGCERRHHVPKSKTKEPPKLLSSSGIRGGKSISVNNFSAQEHPSSKAGHILNFRAMAVLDIKLWTCLWKVRI